MSYTPRHYKKSWKRFWQPALIFGLVLGAGGTSGWVALSTQVPSGSDQESATVQTLAPNQQLSSSGDYQIETISAQVEEAITSALGTTPSGSVSSPRLYTLAQLRFAGVINWGGYKFTYYSQSVLPGGGLSIPGRHVNADGYVCDGDGYIVLANSAPNGTVIATPFGAPGKVYDSGTTGNHFDVYTS